MTTPADQPDEDRIEHLPPNQLSPARLNDAVYKAVHRDDPGVRELAAQIRKHGLLEPIVITQDGVIVSGHRRRVACQLARLLTVRVRRMDILSTAPTFPELLVAYNTQREKTTAEKIREAVVLTDPDEAHAELLRHRRELADRVNARVRSDDLSVITAATTRRRSEISPAKQPMLDAVQKVLDDLREYWPVTLRQVHYRLLNDPPLRNANDPKKRYTNDKNSYSDLSDVLTRARLSGAVPWSAVHDPTRPQTEWPSWGSPGPFVREQLAGFLGGYRRNLLQTQPSYVEIVGEKMTVQAIAERVASEYGVPVCIGRGYSSIDARHQLAGRFKRSGKDRLTLLVLSDLDPEGENIGETLAGSLKSEFDIPNITAVKVALTHAQVREHSLPSHLTAKASSSRAKKFTAKHGAAVYELEALPPAVLSQAVRDAIETTLDMRLLLAETEQEKADAAELAVARRTARNALRDALRD